MNVSGDWLKRTCPLCKQNETKLVPEVFSKNPAESLTYTGTKELFVGFRTSQTFFSFSRCTNCGLLYCPWYFSTEQLDELYSDMPDNLLVEDQ